MMHNNYVSQNYLETKVMAADPVQLVRLLYRGALEAVEQAQVCLQNGDISGRSAKISKATLILNELASNLDHTQGGEISRSLAELYDYQVRRLNDANFKQVAEPLVEVQGLLRTLLEAWESCDVGTGNPGMEYMTESAEYQPLSCTA